MVAESLRITEVPEVDFCGCRIFLGTDNAGLGDNAFRDVSDLFKDIYSDCILDKAKVTQRRKK